MRLLFFVSIMIVALLVAAGAAEFRALRRLASLKVVGLMLIPALVAALAGWIAPPLATKIDEPTVCDQSRIKVCVYAKERVILGQMLDITDTTLALLPESLTSGVVASQRPDEGLLIGLSYSDEARWRNQLQSDLIYGLFVSRCATPSGSIAGESLVIGRTLAEEFEARLTNTSSQTAFASLTAEQLTSWLDSHADKIKSCSLMNADLP